MNYQKTLTIVILGIILAVQPLVGADSSLASGRRRIPPRTQSAPPPPPRSPEPRVPNSDVPAGCVCPSIKIACLPEEALYQKCGNRGIAGCARQNECTLYIKQGAPQCTVVARDPNSQAISLSSQGSIPQLAIVSTIPIGAFSLLNAAALVVSGVTENEPPSNEFIYNQCLIEHEIDHLCRKADQTIPCEVEPTAIALQAQCFNKAIEQYCKGSESQPAPASFCEFACLNYVSYEARDNFSSCFCQQNAGPNSPDDKKESACCGCANNCPQTEVPGACQPYKERVLQVLGRTCTSLVDPQGTHNCKYYGQWRPPWNERIPRCDLYAATEAKLSVP